MAEKNTSTLLILMSYRRSGRMAQWLEATLFRWRKLGCNWVPTPACLLPFFFLSSFFYPSAFYCLFSLLTPLASRDFCENVFLVLCTKIGSFHHIDASFFIVCPLTDHNVASWHCQSLGIHEHEPQASESTKKNWQCYCGPGVNLLFTLTKVWKKDQ